MSGQEYPARPIRFVTTGIGGSTDFAARNVAQGLTESVGWQIVVENRPTGFIANEFVAKAPPDGYVLLVNTDGMWIGPLLQKANYDPVLDFIPISLMSRSVNVLVVHPSLPVKSVKELIALAKAKPGELNYGAGAIGASTHIASELFKYMAGVNIVFVPFKSSGPSVIALIRGELQLMFATTGAITPHIKSGRVRALAVSTLEPSALAPGLPTIGASGLPGYQSASTAGAFAPAKTPATIINRLHQEISRVLNRPEVKERFFNGGVEVVDASPEQAAAAIKSEMARLGRMIKDAGIRVE
ncbi:MAG: tripartite tricarboxylate transporter substrate binding protein [Betaproteobacteria bacterium]|nr:tripartite tricarboxylate transporter substrate binding protein [Betaproteobacteria bacterium]